MHDRAAHAYRRLTAAGRRRVESWAAHPHILDLLTALGAFALMSLDIPGLAAADNSLNGWAATVVLAAGSATLLLRRTAPWVPYAVALFLLGWLHELTLAQFALYSLGRYRGRRAGVAGVVLYVVAAFVFFQLPGWPAHRGDTVGDFLSLVVPIGVLAAGVGIAANRQDLVRALQTQRAETAVLQAVHAERSEVAGDVHDFVGRELTLLCVRSDVLARRARTAGDEAYAGQFEDLGDTARRAHTLLNEIIVQRAKDSTPTPGLDALPALAEQSERAGTPVLLDIDEVAERLSPLRQAAVYRVAQECLTNAAKHAPGEKVQVRITVATGIARVEVTNPLPAVEPTRAPVSTGTGTAGMAERVRSVGGTFAAGPRDGVYEVVAELPAGRGL
ncbi:histidine kinase [Streptomyces sp. TRM66268-LWL]|uniref:histidine kinase n=1 Tax=Streptomyces polyasparticus TaxID=2767826 RepID=A0ABR7SP78_9ACTN|nr:histidine kinase [Streptomyces polyasparticus]MBC9716321.1 histidine kinase [Streptomyces polyasparticus]